ncbi:MULTISPECIES: gliding motility-associated C-terminal domain-containing protein [unclassified Myroides]|uniref:gliding motility-associated C-terminal domain-containing protein n=1 Tax=unclassified Myroides TaxID=2642485 RepID=UPI003D2F7A45
MKKKIELFVCFLVGALPSFGQAPYQNTLVNQGTLSISKDAVVSTSYDFDNTSTGVVQSDGATYYYRNFNNDNLYYPSTGVTTAHAVFMPLDGDPKQQQISGSKPSEFYRVTLNNPTPDMGFDLKNEMNIKGSVDFQDGIVQVDSLIGMLTFHPGAKALQPSDQSHADGYVEKLGKDPFTYPIGDQGIYRPARISSPPNEKELYQSKYVLEDHEFFKNHRATSPSILLLNTREYWQLEKPSSSSGDIMLSLGWDDRTTLSELLKDPEDRLHIVRWDEKEGMWVDEGGIVSVDTREVTTPVRVRGYGYFTLAKVDAHSTANDLMVYNLVTPDGDGKNDYFLIDNLQKYPNNRMEIYNRWGVKVYETTNYGSSDNVFRGYSDGRATVKKKEKLPTGTYFYILTYEKSDLNSSRTIKTSGYLHLETN